MKLTLGIDIGGTNSAFGLCDSDGNIHFEATTPTRAYCTPKELVDYIHNVIDQTSLLNNIIGIGIGAPNGNYFTGNIEFAPNLLWEGIVPLAALFEKKFNIPSFLTNDANAAAMGEKIYGVGKELDDFVLITLGTGLGSGIVIQGNLVYGHNGLAGEYGHIRVIPNGRVCGCGRQGCLETYASATGVVRSIKELDSENKDSSNLVTIINPTAKDVFQHAQKGDLFAKEIIEFTAKILGEALADFACFSNPKAYILFGGIAQSGVSFSQKVKAYMEEGLLTIYKNKIDVFNSELHLKNAAVLGSSSLAWNELNKQL
ncbi:MAG: ROK family protein [Crocinitomicaceae bacterium]|nr:ROK family protein [Crocinitomicaceae bacterium]